jgi:hypothetical protein
MAVTGSDSDGGRAGDGSESVKKFLEPRSVIPTGAERSEAKWRDLFIAST